MTKTELELYKSLFRKKNLKKMQITIPDYAQPLTHLALETDEKLKELIIMMCYIGEDVHLKTFRDFLLEEYKVLKKDKDGKFIEKKYISKGTLDDKLKLLEFMSLIEIKEYRIRLTTQALSYFNENYTKTDRAATLETKLERVTRAKLIAYTSSKKYLKNPKEFEDKNIYKWQKGFVVLKSNDRETINKYKEKLEHIKSLITSATSDKLDTQAVEYMKDKNIDSDNFQVLELNELTIEIKLENAIYNNYKKEIDEIFKQITIVKEWGSKICAKRNIKFKIETF